MKENLDEKVEYPIPGLLYQHYKGGVYEFLFMAGQTETGENLVIYKSITFGAYHARPLESWNGTSVSGQKRFAPFKKD